MRIATDRRRLPPWVYLPKPTCLDRMRAARALMLSGNRDMKFCAVDDSTGRGVIAGGDASQYPSSPFNVLPQFLARYGLQASAAGVWGHGNLTPVTSYDNRLSGTFSNGLATVGGNHLLLTSAAPSLNFTPSEPWDTATVYYVRNTGIGTFSMAVDGGTATQVNGAGTPAAILSATITAPNVGTHTLNLAWVSSSCYITGFECSIAGTKQIMIRNWGTPSSLSTSSNWTGNSNVYDGRPTIRTMAPDVLSYGLAINDWNQTTPTAIGTFTTSAGNVIQDGQLSGDVILITPLPSAASSKSLEVQRTFIDAYYALADQYGCALIDVWRRFGMNDRNLVPDRGLFSDALHGTKSGYLYKAEAIAPVLAY